MALSPALTRTPYVLWDAYPRFNVSAITCCHGLITGSDTGDIISWQYDPSGLSLSSTSSTTSLSAQQEQYDTKLNNHHAFSGNHQRHTSISSSSSAAAALPGFELPGLGIKPSLNTVPNTYGQTSINLPQLDKDVLTPSLFTISQSGCSIVAITNIVTHQGTYIKYNKSNRAAVDLNIAFNSPCAHYIALHSDGTIRSHTPASSESYTITQLSIYDSPAELQGCCKAGSSFFDGLPNVNKSTSATTASTSPTAASLGGQTSSSSSIENPSKRIGAFTGLLSYYPTGYFWGFDSTTTSLTLQSMPPTQQHARLPQNTQNIGMNESSGAHKTPTQAQFSANSTSNGVPDSGFITSTYTNTVGHVTLCSTFTKTIPTTTVFPQQQPQRSISTYSYNTQLLSSYHYNNPILVLFGSKSTIRLLDTSTGHVICVLSHNAQIIRCDMSSNDSYSTINACTFENFVNSGSLQPCNSLRLPDPNQTIPLDYANDSVKELIHAETMNARYADYAEFSTTSFDTDMTQKQQLFGTTPNLIAKKSAHASVLRSSKQNELAAGLEIDVNEISSQNSPLNQTPGTKSYLSQETLNKIPLVVKSNRIPIGYQRKRYLHVLTVDGCVHIWDLDKILHDQARNNITKQSFQVQSVSKGFNSTQLDQNKIKMLLPLIHTPIIRFYIATPDIYSLAYLTRDLISTSKRHQPSNIYDKYDHLKQNHDRQQVFKATANQMISVLPQITGSSLSKRYGLHNSTVLTKGLSPMLKAIQMSHFIDFSKTPSLASTILATGPDNSLSPLIQSNTIHMNSPSHLQSQNNRGTGIHGQPFSLSSTKSTHSSLLPSTQHDKQNKTIKNKRGEQIDDQITATSLIAGSVTYGYSKLRLPPTSPIGDQPISILICDDVHSIAIVYPRLVLLLHQITLKTLGAIFLPVIDNLPQGNDSPSMFTSGAWLHFGKILMLSTDSCILGYDITFESDYDVSLFLSHDQLDYVNNQNDMYGDDYINGMAIDDHNRLENNETKGGNNPTTGASNPEETIHMPNDLLQNQPNNIATGSSLNAFQQLALHRQSKLDLFQSVTFIDTYSNTVQYTPFLNENIQLDKDRTVSANFSTSWNEKKLTQVSGQNGQNENGHNGQNGQKHHYGSNVEINEDFSQFVDRVNGVQIDNQIASKDGNISDDSDIGLALTTSPISSLLSPRSPSIPMSPTKFERLEQEKRQLQRDTGVHDGSSNNGHLNSTNIASLSSSSQAKQGLPQQQLLTNHIVANIFTILPTYKNIYTFCPSRDNAGLFISYTTLENDSFTASNTNKALGGGMLKGLKTSDIQHVDGNNLYSQAFPKRTITHIEYYPIPVLSLEHFRKYTHYVSSYQILAHNEQIEFLSKNIPFGADMTTPYNQVWDQGQGQIESISSQTTHQNQHMFNLAQQQRDFTTDGITYHLNTNNPNTGISYTINPTYTKHQNQLQHVLPIFISSDMSVIDFDDLLYATPTLYSDTLNSLDRLKYDTNGSNNRTQHTSNSHTGSGNDLMSFPSHPSHLASSARSGGMLLYNAPTPAPYPQLLQSSSSATLSDESTTYCRHAIVTCVLTDVQTGSIIYARGYRSGHITFNNITTDSPPFIITHPLFPFYSFNTPTHSCKIPYPVNFTAIFVMGICGLCVLFSDSSLAVYTINTALSPPKLSQYNDDYTTPSIVYSDRQHHDPLNITSTQSPFSLYNEISSTQSDSNETNQKKTNRPLLVSTVHGSLQSGQNSLFHPTLPLTQILTALSIPSHLFTSVLEGLQGGSTTNTAATTVSTNLAPPSAHSNLYITEADLTTVGFSKTSDTSQLDYIPQKCAKIDKKNELTMYLNDKYKNLHLFLCKNPQYAPHEAQLLPLQQTFISLHLYIRPPPSNQIFNSVHYLHSYSTRYSNDSRLSVRDMQSQMLLGGWSSEINQHRKYNIRKAILDNEGYNTAGLIDRLPIGVDLTSASSNLTSPFPSLIYPSVPITSPTTTISPGECVFLTTTQHELIVISLLDRTKVFTLAPHSAPVIKVIHNHYSVTNNTISTFTTHGHLHVWKLPDCSLREVIYRSIDNTWKSINPLYWLPLYVHIDIPIVQNVLFNITFNRCVQKPKSANITNLHDIMINIALSRNINTYSDIKKQHDAYKAQKSLHQELTEGLLCDSHSTDLLLEHGCPLHQAEFSSNDTLRGGLNDVSTKTSIENLQDTPLPRDGTGTANPIQSIGSFLGTSPTQATSIPTQSIQPGSQQQQLQHKQPTALLPTFNFTLNPVSLHHIQKSCPFCVAKSHNLIVDTAHKHNLLSQRGVFDQLTSYQNQSLNNPSELNQSQSLNISSSLSHPPSVQRAMSFDRRQLQNLSSSTSSSNPHQPLEYIQSFHPSVHETCYIFILQPNYSRLQLHLQGIYTDMDNVLLHLINTLPTTPFISLQQQNASTVRPLSPLNSSTAPSYDKKDNMNQAIRATLGSTAFAPMQSPSLSSHANTPAQLLHPFSLNLSAGPLLGGTSGSLHGSDGSTPRQYAQQPPQQPFTTTAARKNSDILDLLQLPLSTSHLLQQQHQDSLNNNTTPIQTSARISNATQPGSSSSQLIPTTTPPQFDQIGSTTHYQTLAGTGPPGTVGINQRSRHQIIYQQHVVQKNRQEMHKFFEIEKFRLKRLIRSQSCYIASILTSELFESNQLLQQQEQIMQQALESKSNSNTNSYAKRPQSQTTAALNGFEDLGSDVMFHDDLTAIISKLQQSQLYNSASMPMLHRDGVNELNQHFSYLSLIEHQTLQGMVDVDVYTIRSHKQIVLDHLLAHKCGIIPVINADLHTTTDPQLFHRDLQHAWYQYQIDLSREHQLHQQHLAMNSFNITNQSQFGSKDLYLPDPAVLEKQNLKNKTYSQFQIDFKDPMSLCDNAGYSRVDIYSEDISQPLCDCLDCSLSLKLSSRSTSHKQYLSKQYDELKSLGVLPGQTGPTSGPNAKKPSTYATSTQTIAQHIGAIRLGDVSRGKYRISPISGCDMNQSVYLHALTHNCKQHVAHISVDHDVAICSSCEQGVGITLPSLLENTTVTYQIDFDLEESKISQQFQHVLSGGSHPHNNVSENLSPHFDEIMASPRNVLGNFSIPSANTTNSGNQNILLGSPHSTSHELQDGQSQSPIHIDGKALYSLHVQHSKLLLKKMNQSLASNDFFKFYRRHKGVSSSDLIFNQSNIIFSHSHTTALLHKTHLAEQVTHDIQDTQTNQHDSLVGLSSHNEPQQFSEGNPLLNTPILYQGESSIAMNDSIYPTMGLVVINNTVLAQDLVAVHQLCNLNVIYDVQEFLRFVSLYFTLIILHAAHVDNIPPHRLFSLIRNVYTRNHATNVMTSYHQKLMFNSNPNPNSTNTFPSDGAGSITPTPISSPSNVFFQNGLNGSNHATNPTLASLNENLHPTPVTRQLTGDTHPKSSLSTIELQLHSGELHNFHAGHLPDDNDNTTIMHQHHPTTDYTFSSSFDDKFSSGGQLLFNNLDNLDQCQEEQEELIGVDLLQCPTLSKAIEYVYIATHFPLQYQPAFHLYRSQQQETNLTTNLNNGTTAPSTPGLNSSQSRPNTNTTPSIPSSSTSSVFNTHGFTNQGLKGAVDVSTRELNKTIDFEDIAVQSTSDTQLSNQQQYHSILSRAEMEHPSISVNVDPQFQKLTQQAGISNSQRSLSKGSDSGDSNYRQQFLHNDPQHKVPSQSYHQQTLLPPLLPDLSFDIPPLIDTLPDRIKYLYPFAITESLSNNMIGPCLQNIIGTASLLLGIHSTSFSLPFIPLRPHPLVSDTTTVDILDEFYTKSIENAQAKLTQASGNYSPNQTLTPSKKSPRIPKTSQVNQNTVNTTQSLTDLNPKFNDEDENDDTLASAATLASAHRQLIPSDPSTWESIISQLHQRNTYGAVQYNISHKISSAHRQLIPSDPSTWESIISQLHQRNTYGAVQYNISHKISGFLMSFAAFTDDGDAIVIALPMKRNKSLQICITDDAAVQSTSSSSSSSTSQHTSPTTISTGSKSTSTLSIFAPKPHKFVELPALASSLSIDTYFSSYRYIHVHTLLLSLVHLLQTVRSPSIPAYVPPQLLNITTFQQHQAQQRKILELRQHFALQQQFSRPSARSAATTGPSLQSAHLSAKLGPIGVGLSNCLNFFKGTILASEVNDFCEHDIINTDTHLLTSVPQTPGSDGLSGTDSIPNSPFRTGNLPRPPNSSSIYLTTTATNSDGTPAPILSSNTKLYPPHIQTVVSILLTSNNNTIYRRVAKFLLSTLFHNLSVEQYVELRFNLLYEFSAYLSQTIHPSLFYHARANVEQHTATFMQLEQQLQRQNDMFAQQNSTGFGAKLLSPSVHDSPLAQTPQQQQQSQQQGFGSTNKENHHIHKEVYNPFTMSLEPSRFTSMSHRNMLTVANINNSNNANLAYYSNSSFTSRSPLSTNSNPSIPSPQNAPPQSISPSQLALAPSLINTSTLSILQSLPFQFVLPSPELYMDISLQSLTLTKGQLPLPVLYYHIDIDPLLKQTLQQYLSTAVIYSNTGVKSTTPINTIFTGNGQLHPGIELTNDIVTTLYLLSSLEVTQHSGNMTIQSTNVDDYISKEMASKAIPLPSTTYLGKERWIPTVKDSAAPSISVMPKFTKLTFSIIPAPYYIYPSPTTNISTYIANLVAGRTQHARENRLQLITHYLLLQLQICLSFWNLGTTSISEANVILKFLSSYYDSTRLVKVGEDELTNDSFEDRSIASGLSSPVQSPDDYATNTSTTAYLMHKLPPPTINITYVRNSGSTADYTTHKSNTLTTTVPIVLPARTVSILTLICSQLAKGYILWAPHINNKYDLIVKLHCLSQLTVYPNLAQQATLTLLHIGRTSPRIFIDAVVRQLFSTPTPTPPPTSSQQPTQTPISSSISLGNDSNINPVQTLKQLNQDFFRFCCPEDDSSILHASSSNTATQLQYTIPQGIGIVSYSVKDHNTLPTDPFTSSSSKPHMPHIPTTHHHQSQSDQAPPDLAQYLTFSSFSQFSNAISPTILFSLITLIHKHPDIIFPFVPKLAQLIVRILDPHFPHQRKSLLKHSTLLIHTLINTYPNICFDKPSQRLIVASHSYYISPQSTVPTNNRSAISQSAQVRPTSTLTAPVDSNETTTAGLDVFANIGTLSKQQQAQLQQYKESNTYETGTTILYDLRSASKIRGLYDKTLTPITACSISTGSGHFCATYNAFEFPTPLFKVWSLPSTSVIGSFFHSNPKCVNTFQLPKLSTSIPLQKQQGVEINKEQLDAVLNKIKIKWEVTQHGKKQVETCILIREDGSSVRCVCGD